MDPKTAKRLEHLQADIARFSPWLEAEEAPFCAAVPGGLPAPAFAMAPVTPGVPAGPLADWPAAALARAVEQGLLSPAEVVRACLERIAERNPGLNAFVAVMADEALAEAGGPAGSGPLSGLPLAVKDLYHVRGWPTRAGSRLRAHAPPEPADSALVAQLRAAGAVPLGKTATHEFAYGCTTDSPFCGPTRNPADPARSPGGSSGGSAAAVAAGMAPLALGTDTAGSVRIPAACCGVVGLKPTIGRLSGAGILPLSWSLDHPGLLARTVGDTAMLWEALGGAAPPAGRPAGLKGLVAGVPADWVTTPMEPEVRAGFEQGLRLLEDRGAAVAEVTLPPLDLCHFVSRVITLAEAGAYHAPNLDRLEEYGPDVRSRVALGQYVTARDYLLARRLRSRLCREFAGAMAGVHLLVTPTQPMGAPLIGQRTVLYPGGREEAVAEALIRFAAPFNVTGQPAISIPLGTGSIQLAGPPDGETLLLQVAAALTA